MHHSIMHSLQDKIKWIRTHRYTWILLYIPLYLLYFGWLQGRDTETVLISVALDEIIPTIPLFFIPYAVWWLLFPGALLYFLFASKEDFLKLCFILFSGYTVCLLVYTFFPNGLALREPLEGNDLCTKGILWLRSIDPPRNVCPSMHVSSTVAIDLTVRQSTQTSRWVKNAVTVTAILIILSTMFIRQHSIVDVILGILLSLILYRVYCALVDKQK